MSMQRIHRSPSMTAHLVEAGCFRSDNLVVVDVGASGGFESHWAVYGDQLGVLGFETDPAECERLSRLEKNPKVRYFPIALHRDRRHLTFHLGAVEQPPERQEAFDRSLWGRSSTREASRAKTAAAPAEKPANLYLDPTPRTVELETLDLDGFCDEHAIARIDFIKTDTDGGDLDVLTGALRSLEGRGVLGVCVEVCFQREAAQFSDVDRLLAKAGFLLYDLDVYRYSRRHLPAPFRDPSPAQTISGQIWWGNALYFRDVVGPAGRPSWITPTGLLK
ncbi:FkbM family methyltransferase, partial [bacterium]|nr:FkbM family methyltransferase [bacterium]